MCAERSEHHLNAHTMSALIIKSYREGFTTEEPHFFALSKGNNAGKPLVEPCPNCFAVIAETEQERDFYFRISYGLWKLKAFQYYLRGSVIPFIIIKEYRKCLEAGAEKAKSNTLDFYKSLKMLRELDQYEQKMKESAALIEQVRKAIYFKHLKA